MSRRLNSHVALLAVALAVLGHGASAVPTVTEDSGRTLLSGAGYRLTFVPESAGFGFEVRGPDGQWRNAAAKSAFLAPTWFEGSEHSVNGVRATWARLTKGDTVVVGQQVPLDPVSGAVLELHFLCSDAGVLMGVRVVGAPAGGAQSRLWWPPRTGLEAADWDGYLLWGPDGEPHEGRIASLDPCPAYAGVSPWGDTGDTVPALDPQHPALIVKSSAGGAGLGVVFVDYTDRWARSQMFLQRHQPTTLLLYAGFSPLAEAAAPLWAWLAPFAPADAADAASAARQVETLVAAGHALTQRFQPIARPVPEEWTRPLPDFPVELRRPEPVKDLNDAAVFTINEHTNSDYGVNLAKKLGSDVLIRAWFKWGQAPPVADWKNYPTQVHPLGALFGGGITCSALYDQENGITHEQLLDMATRSPAGQLVDAWDTPGIRHGSLSSPAYLDYLFRWCREQIDAGADYLFMDEHTAALGSMEGYDDHSLADFRSHLLQTCPQTQGWQADDRRWADELKIDLADKQVCPDGTMRSFDYRAYMRQKGVLEKPRSADNPLTTFWSQFRSWRDDRAWKVLTDRIRAYAKEQGRTLLISANGIAKYVDLQVLGVWGQWTTKDGHVDLSENQLPYWRSLVLRGRSVAEKRVPVVLFHDWGCGDPPFPWLAVPPSERGTWMRTRGAEIYAAGGFFAFPVLGPFGCDAGRDGSLPVIAAQTAFYQRHRDLYLHGRYLAAEPLKADGDQLTLAAWWTDEPRALLVHTINRDFRDGRLQPQGKVTIRVPVDRAPDSAMVISPDWQGEQPATCRLVDDMVEVTLPALDAYAVAILRYSADVDLTRLRDPARLTPTPLWSQPTRNEFRVLPDGLVEHSEEVNGYLQGMLHTHLRNPPTFLVNAAAVGELRVKVRAVSMGGAKLEYRVDGETKQVEDLPDLDGKNDGGAPEYDKVLTFPIPTGRHRLTLDNVGADWAVISWLEFGGTFAD